MSEPAIAIEGLTKHFGGTVAVDGVQLQVARGEIFGLIGPDGAGKTTLMRMLAGILAPTSGTARVAGCDVVTDPEGVKQRLGYLSQAFSLYGDLTVDENIQFAADMYLTPPEQVEALKREMLGVTGLAPFAKRLAGRLSGGMKQKLGLTCALVHRPEVLLLDEPTTGVDPVSRRDFYRILAGLPEQGVTVLLSSPYMDEASRCHRLALMAGGRILDQGTADELCSRVEGVMLELVTSEPRAAAATLAPVPGVLGLTPFGDSLHIRTADEQVRPRVERALTDAGVPIASLQAITPSLEDAFVERVHGGATP